MTPTSLFTFVLSGIKLPEMALTAAIIGAVVVLLAPAHGERIHALEAAEQVWYSRRDLSSSLSPLLNKLHDIVAEKSLLYNTSFSIGVYDANVGAFEVTVRTFESKQPCCIPCVVALQRSGVCLYGGNVFLYLFLFN